jgi:hypothetical protein
MAAMQGEDPICVVRLTGRLQEPTQLEITLMNLAWQNICEDCGRSALINTSSWEAQGGLQRRQVWEVEKVRDYFSDL